MSLINIGLTGIRANQAALDTTGNNISNANTDGYSRQRVDFASNPSQATGDGYIGQGVNIADIQRLNDEFINTQLRSDTTLHSEQSSLLQNLSGLDDLLGNENTGLNQSLTQLFGTLQSAAENPSSGPLRAQVLNQADSLVARFSSVDSQLRDREDTVNNRIQSDLSEINSLADGIAELNLAIAEAPGRAQGREANDLLDKRDEKLRQLSELVQVQSSENKDGTVDVNIGKGQGLVSKGSSATLALTGSTELAGKREIVTQGIGEDRAITHEITGGSLGGNLTFRDEVLEPTINSIGRIAIGLSETMNGQHEKGLDLNGQLGRNFFTDINGDEVARGRITPAQGNPGPDDREARVNITDSSKLGTASYELEFTGPDDREYRLRDATTGEIAKTGKISDSLPSTISMDGFEIKLEGGSFQAGDKFTVRPTYSGAQDLGVALSSGDDLALALPIRSETNSGNQGSGSINQGTMLDVRDPVTGRRLDSINQKGELTPPMEIRFISETRYEVLDVSDPANPKALEPPINNARFEPGRTNQIFSGEPGSSRITMEGNALEEIGTTNPGENGYGAQEVTVRTRDPETGRITTQPPVDLNANQSAREIADKLRNAEGVDASAYTEIRLEEFSGDDVQLTLKVAGAEATLDVNGALDAQSLQQAIDDSSDFSALDLTVVNDGDGINLRSNTGEDIQIDLDGGTGPQLDVVKINPYDATNNFQAELNPTDDSITVGGVVDPELADGVRLTANNDNIFQSAPTNQDNYKGFQFELSGNPEAGDRFRILSNQNGTSDNRNGLALGNLNAKGVFEGGSESFSDAYGSVVEDVGSRTRTAQVDEEASRTLKEQSQAQWEEQSGVNLDEEAGKLVQFQNAYSASAQVVSVARELFNTLIGTFR